MTDYVELDINRRHMHRIHHIHFIGIGGSGMNVIAEVMLKMGYQISGSDGVESPVTKRLSEMGATIFIGHAAAQIAGANLLVRSSAIALNNIEVLAAKASHIPVIGRAEMLAEVMRFRFGIAVSGTHGKTTTTSMLASVLTDATLSPSYLIGGILNREGTGAKLGKGQYLIAEADESDASFLNLTPMMAILLNIDEDHMETYSGDFNKLKQTFVDFLQRMPFYGLAVVCIDDVNIREILDRINRPLKTFGLSKDADIHAKNLVANGLKTNFDLVVLGQEMGSFSINMPGKHNVSNALAVIAVALELDIDINVINSSLQNFAGVGRRFSYRGDISIMNNSINNNDSFVINNLVPVFEDYGHHPNEILAVYEAAKSAFPDKKIVGVFQPHRYSRTRDMFDSFSEVLAKFDKLVLAEVYPAGEKYIAQADGKSLTAAIRARKQVEPIFVAQLDAVAKQVISILDIDDVVLVMGAGSIGRVATELVSLDCKNNINKINNKTNQEEK